MEVGRGAGGGGVHVSGLGQQSATSHPKTSPCPSCFREFVSHFGDEHYANIPFKTFLFLVSIFSLLVLLFSPPFPWPIALMCVCQY